MSISTLPLSEDWLSEEPDGLFFSESIPEEPPDLFFDTSAPDEPPNLTDEDFVLARLNEYVPPPIPSAVDYPVPEAFYADEPLDLPTEVYPSRGELPPAMESVERESTWRLQQAGILIEEVYEDKPTGDHYAVGVLEVWQDPHTGKQSGAYLHMADAPHLERAEEMRRNIYHLADEAGVSDHELGNFAYELIKERNEWQLATEAQWANLDKALAPDTPDFMDDATWTARDRLLGQAFEMVGDELEREEIDQPHELQTVMRGLGLDAADFDPATNPPPLFDENSNTMYWIGVYQPDPSNPNEAVTSILSISQDDSGQPVAHLAPVATGDWDQAYQTAEYLLTVAEQTQDVGQVLDAAESMAVANQQHELWGMSVEDDIAFSPVEIEIE